MVANQGKYATYSAEIKPMSSGEPASGPGLGAASAQGLGLPAVVLGPGILAYDHEAAAVVPPEDNLRYSHLPDY